MSEQDKTSPETRPQNDAGRVATLFVVKLVVLTLLLDFGEKYLKHIGWGGDLQVAIATVAAGLARLFDSGIEREGNFIAGSKAGLVVSLECTALFAKALFCAAAISFPARWRDRLAGCLIGVFGVAALNVFRIAGLVLIARHVSGLFHFAHLVLMQWFLISCVGPLWLLWAVWATQRAKKSIA